jgi:hypothetical protein
MVCQSRMTYRSSSVHQPTAWSSSLMYSIGVRSRHATGWTGMRTSFAPISLALTKWSLLQCPCISSLSGSEIDKPRNSTVFPLGSTNLFPLTVMSGICLLFAVSGRRPGAASRHQVWSLFDVPVCAGCTGGLVF